MTTRHPLLVSLTLSLAGALALGTSARAEKTTTTPKPAAPPPQVKATAIALPHPGVTDEVMVKVLRTFEAGLKQNRRLDVKDLDTRLADFASEVPQDQVDAARQLYKDGQQAMLELNLPAAQQKLQDSVTELAKVLPYIKKQELADAMASLAVAHVENGDKAAAKRDFVRLLIWRQDYSYDVAKLPPKYLGLFEEAQREVEKLKKGSLKLSSTPEGAQAYVDGKYVGVTPCTVADLVAGEHFVTLKKEGYKKAVTPATVVFKKEPKVEVALDRNEKYLLIEQATASLEKTIGVEQTTTEMNDFRQVLYLDHAIFLRVKPQGDNLQVGAWLYDLRQKRRLSQVEKTVAQSNIEADVATMPQALYVSVTNYGPDIEKPKEKEPPKQNIRPPIYKTWWFWTAAGVVVLGAAGAGTAIALTAQPSCPDNMLCPTLSF